ncbi:hypothetical protein [Pseudomonas syringae]|uniref:Uncharacterized protein n=1 Tax=Pseudomonas syringae TaxID=317 RepID=A0A085V6P0_PSESX|nr:hypothetical protein [Pseudomonas syringae]KFE51103.1 hypothetical protein IV02_13915 [Pseudomonas syringae]
MQALKRRTISPAALPAIGQPLAGGFYAGRLFFAGSELAVVDAGAEFEILSPWGGRSGPRLHVRGAQSYEDGLSNTVAMAEAGSEIAKKVLGMVIRGHRGWHIPALRALELMRSNLPQLPEWEQYSGKQAFGARHSHHSHWSSTQKSAGSAWNLTMYPWCTPNTNWAKDEKWIRPVKVLLIKPEAFVHEPSTDIATNVAVTDLGGLSASPAVAEVLGQFINEDTGRFYGRTDDLLAQLAAVAGESRP